MKIYVAGRITGNDNFIAEFKQAEDQLKAEGHVVINPTMLPPGFLPGEYLSVCIPMLTICDAIYLLKGWETSQGALIEKRYADYAGKTIIYQS